MCRSCGRGLCAECAAEVGLALACRQRCEEDVRQLTDALKRQIQMTRPMGHNMAAIGTVYRTVRGLLLGIGVIVILLGGGLGAWEMTKFRPRTVEVVLELGLALIGVLVVAGASRLPIPQAPPVQPPE